MLACLWCELGLLGLKDIHFHPGFRVRDKKCKTRSSGEENNLSDAELYSQYTQSGCTFQLLPLKYSVTEKEFDRIGKINRSDVEQESV